MPASQNADAETDLLDISMWVFKCSAANVSIWDQDGRYRNQLKESIMKSHLIAAALLMTMPVPAIACKIYAESASLNSYPGGAQGISASYVLDAGTDEDCSQPTVRLWVWGDPSPGNGLGYITDNGCDTSTSDCGTAVPEGACPKTISMVALCHKTTAPYQSVTCSTGNVSLGNTQCQG
jgi:hypothetical protein